MTDTNPDYVTYAIGLVNLGVCEAIIYGVYTATGKIVLDQHKIKKSICGIFNQRSDNIDSKFD